MKILILEDNVERSNKFKNNLIGHDVIHVINANECIDLLKNNVYNVIFLDNDLWDKEGYDPNNCGLNVVQYIKDNDIKSKVIVHSLNVPVAIKMTLMLNQACYIPFAWDYISLILDGLNNK